MKICDLQKFEKFIFPVHCPGYWWRVKGMENLSPFFRIVAVAVFGLFYNVFQYENIDLSSLRKLTQHDKTDIPSYSVSLSNTLP